MARTKALFLSDFHLSSQERYDDPEFPHQYKPDMHTPRLTNFIKNYIDRNKQILKDVVLLGDIFDTWACPANTPPPTVDQIILSNPEVISAFGEIISDGVRLLFVEGNHDHDSDTARKKVRQLIDGIVIAKHYLNGRIYATHGNQYDIFNKFDYLSDPANGMPIGYFITRLSNSIPGGGDALRNIPAYFDDLLESVFTPQNLFASMIEALAEKAGISDDEEVVLPDANAISINKLKARYQIFGRQFTTDEVVANIYERRYLNVPADRLCHEKQYKVVVLGHTHKKYMDKDWLFVSDRVYANTGAWCTDVAHCVEIDYRPGSSPSTIVRLLEVLADGAYKTISKESL